MVTSNHQYVSYTKDHSKSSTGVYQHLSVFEVTTYNQSSWYVHNNDIIINNSDIIIIINNVGTTKSTANPPFFQGKTDKWKDTLLYYYMPKYVKQYNVSQTG